MDLITKQLGKYYIEREIGVGGFATVFLGRDVKTNEKLALKVIERKQATDRDILLYVEQELRIMSRLNHPNIAKVHDIIYTEEYIMIAMEYMEMPDLQTLITDKFVFSDHEKLKIAIELLDATSYLHERGICHRDIKPSNIMFDNNLHPKIIDFGFCREQTDNLTTYCGTELYMAPEIISNQTYNGMKADVWAYGVTMHALDTGSLPFEYNSDVKLINSMKNNTLKIINRSLGIIGWLVENSLKLDPEERMSAIDMYKEVKDQCDKESSLPMMHFPCIRRANTNASIPKIRIHINTPLIVRARVPTIPFARRKQIRSLE